MVMKIASLKFSTEEEPSFHNVKIDDKGNVKYYNENKQLHRLDGPAIEWQNGDKEWRINGKLHREDGPAVEYANGDRAWYQNDKFHRLDGPAIEYANGEKKWLVNNDLHRLDGPAIERSNGDKEWYVHDVFVGDSREGFTDRDFERWKRKHVRRDGSVIDEEGNVEYFNENGQTHRLGGPAIIWPDGTKFWYVNGKQQRLDGPAVEFSDGSKEWWVNDNLIGKSEEGFTDKDFEQWKKEHGL